MLSSNDGIKSVPQRYAIQIRLNYLLLKGECELHGRHNIILFCDREQLMYDSMFNHLINIKQCFKGYVVTI